MQFAYLLKMFFNEIFKLLHVDNLKDQIIKKNNFNIHLFNFSI